MYFLLLLNNFAQTINILSKQPVEGSTFSNIQTEYFYKNCQKIKQVVFYETWCT